jgi:Domain of unknown function (DUF4397)
MKKYIILSIIAISLLGACKEDFVITHPLTVNPDGARLRFINHCPDCPSALVYVNGNKVSSQAVTFGLSATTMVPSTDYAVAPAGALKVRFGRVISATASDSTYYEATVNVENGKYYNVILTDSFKVMNHFVVDNGALEIPAPADTAARIRFVHALVNSRDTLEVVRKTDGAILGNAQVKNASAWLPIRSEITDTFFVRKAGSTTPYSAATPSFINKFAKGRIHSIIYRGQQGGTVGNRLPRLDFTPAHRQ